MSTEQKSTIENNSTSPKQATRKNNAGQRFFSGMHTFVYRLFGGKMVGRFGASPVLLLTTIGRKTGQARTWPLLYLKDGERFVLVASNSGAQNHPSWWLNLQAQPDAEIQIGNKKIAVTAVQAEPEEKKRLWPQLVAMYSDYAEYQKRTEREIPVVILHPRQVQ